MEHLSISDVINYVTASKVDRETLDLMSKVNFHIRSCSACREKIEAFEAAELDFDLEIEKDFQEKGNFVKL